MTRDAFARLERTINGVFLGKARVVRLVLTSFFAGGHVLLEDVPGVGKTLLARTLARAVDADFGRIQCTPDLLPADMLGTSVFHQASGEFEFKPGPVFRNVILVDEINRTTPRTQSALLEAMNEASVSLDGVTHELPAPFAVLATQNPHEFEGTYPLPESQLDRFLMRLTVGYPARADEERMLEEQRTGYPLDDVRPVLSREEAVGLQRDARRVRFDDSLRSYLLDVVEATRRHSRIHIGISPRGALALQRAAQTHAFLDGRDYVVPDDVKGLAVPTLAHRLVPAGVVPGDPGSGVRKRLLEEVLAEIEVPL
ncbi:MAG: AAA family ATPase [Planctomycetota bacterium]